MNKKNIKNIIARVIALAFALFLISNVPNSINYKNAYAEEIPPQALSYYGVPGFFGYWYEDWNGGYFYQEWGTAAKKTLPDMSLGDVWLPNTVVTTVNVPIDKEINKVVVYKSIYDDTGIVVGNPNDMKYYTSLNSEVRQANYTPKPNGTTDVDLVIDLLVLSKANAQQLGEVYKTYIHFVVEYVEKAYLEDPEGWKEEHLGSGNIDVTVQYKDEDGKKLIDDKTRKTRLGANLIENSERIDGYRCIGYSVTGKETKSFSGNSTSFVVGLFDYTTPINNNLNITFYYEEYEEEPKPTCDPQFDAEAEDARVTMKRRDFENVTDIFYSNIRIAVEDFEGGHKQISGTEWEEVEGEHNFKSFDIYLKYPGSTGYDFTRYDIYSQSVLQSINIPASKFTATNPEKTEYVANVDVLLGVLCSCGGFNAENTTLRLYVDIVENQPPDAYYRYATKKILPSGDESRVYNRAYIGEDVIIDNYCDDPNGLTDIDYVRFTFKNQNNPEQVKSIQFKMMPWGAYELEEADNFEDTSITFIGTDTNGSIDLQFNNEEEWEVTVYVQDTEGLNDSYTEVIKSEELTLKPTAVIKDTSSYRYPYGVEFNGKQNRVIKLNSYSSYVASWLLDMDVIIDHSKDMWEIEPLDGQDINSVKFERYINKGIIGNILNARYEPLDIKIMFKEAGRYKIRLQVTDTEGNISDWSEHIITINPDLAPTVTANINPKYYRNSSKNAVITFNALASSNDLDSTTVDNISYKYDSNNDGSFADETIQTANITHKDIIVDGIIYKQITLTANKIGKYQFLINVKESFGQETIDKYIEAEDYKTASISIATEVDNIAPVASLGLQKENNIDVKILTSGLTGTRSQDLQSNLSNLKNWLESKNNIKIGDIEVISLSNEVDGLLPENALTWKKVTFNRATGASKYNDDAAFKYKENEDEISKPWSAEVNPETFLAGFWYDLLPNGIYADGWNGIPVPEHYFGHNIGGWTDLTEVQYKHIKANPSENFDLIEKDTFKLEYTPSRVRMGYLSGRMSIWGDLFVDPSMFSAISEKTIKDFDINFTFSVTPWEYAEVVDVGNSMFMWNVKDKNNYFAYVEFYQKRSNLPTGEIVQVKNGIATVLKTFYYEYDSGDDADIYINVTRIKQVGNKIQAFSRYGKLLFEYNTSGSDAGGHLGFSIYDGYCTTNATLNISSLKYIEDANIYTAIDKLQWNDSDRYILNLVEGNKIEELTNEYAFNRTLIKLQEKNVCLINIGVDSVNGSKLKSLVTKNNNNGTFIELGNIYNNLKSSADYITNKYNGISDIGQYLLLGESVDNTEYYSDAENDVKMFSEFKYSHEAAYFDHNIGSISNNNIWIRNPITVFNKTGKYTLNYRAKDNPFNPDVDEFNPFSNYRKYSNIFSKDIYVHRKPKASFSIGSSFENNILNYFKNAYEDFEADLDPPVETITKTIEDTSFSIPDEAYDISLKIKTNYSAGTVRIYPDSGSSQSNSFSSGETYTFELSNSTESVRITNLTMSRAVVTLIYTSEVRGYVESNKDIAVNVPDDAINAKFTYTSRDYDSTDQASITIYADGVSLGNTTNDEVAHSMNVPSGTDVITVSIHDTTDETVRGNIYGMSVEYYQPNPNLIVPMVENSYDLDHTNLSSKGITSWEWKVMKQDGTISSYSASNRSTGITWVQNYLSASYNWKDSTILLRVKDMEGAWSDWSSTFMSGDGLLDPGADNSDISVLSPIADFSIDKDPLYINYENQTITDMSYDPANLTLSYIWTVKKGNITLFTSMQKDINSILNSNISTNGVGVYEVSLVVVNSSGVYSDRVTKSFNVVLHNYAPTVDFNLVSNENPAWVFPKIIGLQTLKYRPLNSLFYDEKAKFNVNVTDLNTDNTGFIYGWKLERFTVKNINNISGAAANTYSYTTQYPFTNSFKGQGLPWGAYRITLSVTDKPPIPPYQSTDAKTATVTKSYYIVPELSLTGSFESASTEIMVGDTITLKAKTSKETENVICTLEGTTFTLSKVSEDSSFAYWEKNITIPDSITESGTYQLQFVGNTTYGGNGNVTREVRDSVPIVITSLKLINFRITDIVNHPDVSFPKTKDMLESQLIPYKAGYYVTFRIDSKGKPDNVYGRIDISNNGSIDKIINLTKVVTGDTETWQGRFYTSSYLPESTIISIKLDCNKGTTTYDYNLKESWDGRSLVTNGSALQDGRVNLTN